MKKIIMIFLLSLVSMTSMTSMAQAQYSEIADGIKPPVYIDVEVVSSEDPTLKLKYQCRTRRWIIRWVFSSGYWF